MKTKIQYWLIAAGVITCFSAVALSTIFQSHLMDGWYPGDPKKLTLLIKTMETQAQEQFGMKIDSRKLRAIIVPHAGYAYSGNIAAAVYRLCPRNYFDRIIILAPDHSGQLKGIAVPDFNAYHVPTGVLSIDQVAVKNLESHDIFMRNNGAFLTEHALEVQLPFITHYMPRARIVPLIVGSIAASGIDSVAQKIASIITPKTLVIVSSDLTHYGQRFNYTPFSDLVELRLRQLDSSFLLPLQYNKFSQVKSVLALTGATVCGTMPLAILGKLIENASLGVTTTRLVAYGNSNAVTHDDSHIVSYASLIVTQEQSRSLNSFEKRSLLTMARDVLAASFEPKSDPALHMPVLTCELERKASVFVTLYAHDGKNRNLRGCIGTTHATQPLYKAVADMVIAAAHDPRFAPVEKSELPMLSIEISVLTDPVPVKSYRDIVLNKHGIILSVGQSTALFLPKVPLEHGFDRVTTLEHLSEKAGLDKNAWRQPKALFKVFEAIDFTDFE